MRIFKEVFRIFITVLLVTINTSDKAFAKINVTNFQHLSTQDGLSQKSVRKIFQDSRGFLWFGTQEGLNRYDGINFTHFKYSKTRENSISNDVIRDILEDQKGNLWIATSAGLNQFEINSGTFNKINIKDRKNQSIERLNTLYLDGDTLHIGTDGHGIISINIDSKTQFDKVKSFSVINSKDIRKIMKDSRDRLWVGTDGQGIWIFDKNNKPINLTQLDNKLDSLSHNRVRSILEDHKGQIWVGTRGGGLNRFDELTRTFFRYQNKGSDKNSLSNNRVYSLLEDRNDNLWIGTDSGINLYRESTDDFQRVEYLASQKYGISHNRILDIFEDEGGMVWIGTLAGLNLWNPNTSKFAQYIHISESKNSLSNNTVSSFAESRSGNIFISTFGGGIDSLLMSDQRINRVFTRVSKKGLHDLRLTTLLYDSQERLWVGSATKGVRVYDKELNVIANYFHDEKDDGSLSANGITDIFEDRDGFIWIATYGAGINRLNPASNTFKRYKHSITGINPLSNNKISSNNIYQIFEDDEGYIWLATDGGGLSRLDKTSNEFISIKNEASNPNSLSSNTAWTILQDSKGRFWVGTQGHGLNRWEPENRRLRINKFKHYTIDNGMRSSTVNGVVEDNEGYIWISTNKGVSRLNPETDEFKHYNLSDETHYNEFIQSSILKASDGRIYLGGENGITAFYPTEITENKHVPQVQLTNVFSENRAIAFDHSLNGVKEVNFDHNDYLITFEFSALDFSQPERNQYQYKLRGFDPEWVKVGSLNRATYTNLPAGNYTFLVKASNNDGLWSKQSIDLKVKIAPAPWASWWALILYATIFCLLLIMFVHSQAKRIAGQERFKNKLIKDVDHEKQLIEKENIQLYKQIDEFQNFASNDFNTGLPNQKYFIDQLILILQLLSQINNSGSSVLKLTCTMINLEMNSKLTNNTSYEESSEAISRIANILKTHLKNVQLIARWDSTQLAILDLTNESSSFAKNICNPVKTEEFTEDVFQNLKLSIGYSETPFRMSDKNSYNWEYVVKLTEHAMKNAELSEENAYIGLEACHQELNAPLLSSLMTSHLLNRSDIFDLRTSISH